MNLLLVRWAFGVFVNKMLMIEKGLVRCDYDLTFTVLNNKQTTIMENSNKVRKSGYIKYTADFLEYFKAYSEFNPRATKAINF